MAEDLQHYMNQITLARTEIKNLRQQISALKHEHAKDIGKIKTALNTLVCGNCGDRGVILSADAHFPSKKPCQCKIPAPWFDSECTAAIQSRKMAEKNYNVAMTKENFRKYQEAAAKAKKIIAKKKREAKTVANKNNEEPSTSNGDCIPYKPIGVIETTFQNKRAVPRQPTVSGNCQGTLVIDNTVFNNPEHALMGLEEFSHIWIIFHFHMTESNSVPAKVSPPRLGGERLGVFATRSPHRPCPIGLSLVKIQRIEGNKIHFLGVDMVNGTPVLDIKPYIPQYDRPTPDLTRPHTEGTNDVLGAVAGLNLGGYASGIPTHITHPIGVETNSPSRSPFGDIPSPGTNILTPMSPSPESLSEEVLHPRTPTRRPDERGAPDGQERFTPPANLNPNDGIRIASWISNPPAQVYQVRFTEDALSRLDELIGDRAQAFRDNIESLLSEDPRSQYVRTRYPDHEYSCVLEDLSISCVFDGSSSVCTIIALRSAEEMQTG